MTHWQTSALYVARFCVLTGKRTSLIDYWLNFPSNFVDFFMEIHKDKKWNLQISLTLLLQSTICLKYVPLHITYASRLIFFPWAMFLPNYLVLRTDLYNVCREISEHIFRPNGSYCLIFNLSFNKMDGKFVLWHLAEFDYDEYIHKANKRWHSHQNTNSGKKRTQFLVIMKFNIKFYHTSLLWKKFLKKLEFLLLSDSCTT